MLDTFTNLQGSQTQIPPLLQETLLDTFTNLQGSQTAISPVTAKASLTPLRIYKVLKHISHRRMLCNGLTPLRIYKVLKRVPTHSQRHTA
jgi:hypothetical protein